MVFPSAEFDEAVGAVCHGTASDEQMLALQELLRRDRQALDEYILRVELHSRLASEPDLFASAAPKPATAAPCSESAGATGSPEREGDSSQPAVGRLWWRWAVAVAACVALLTAEGWRTWRASHPAAAMVPISKAIAMLNQTVDARWRSALPALQLGAPLEPGLLRLESGLAQIVFYSGARVVIEGPAELQLLSPSRASCRLGKVIAEVPAEARGFRLDTPQGTVTDLGTSFGLDVDDRRTEVHVFKGRVMLRATRTSCEQTLREGGGAVVENSGARRLIEADRAAYAALFNVRERSIEAEALRLEQWRAAGEVLNRDPSLRVRFDFEHTGSLAWQLQNVAQQVGRSRDATIVGCQLAVGRWPEKRALQFQSVSDRVRVNVPGEFTSVTLAAWVRVQGLDRQLNSLFMCDGFAAGTLHWLVRNDGVLGLTVVGSRAGDYQVAISPSVVTLDRLGMWLHLAVVVDGATRRVIHYVNGRPVGEIALRIGPPYRVGTAELGNWDGRGFPENDPFMIRNFSGVIDDFCLFGRSLDALEIQTLYRQGKPDLDAVTRHE
jgi:hypothetical protein